MVAYSFRKQFAEPILAGTKGGTVRSPRRNGHAKPGDQLQLYQGMRTAQCRLIMRKTCRATEAITLVLHGSPRIIFSASSSPAWRSYSSDYALDLFARFDGFADWNALGEFWWREHNECDRFDGWHIRWNDLPPELRQ